MRLNISRLMMSVVRNKTIWALSLLATLSLETQAGVVVSGGTLTSAGSGSGYTEGLNLVDPAVPPSTDTTLAPGASFTYKFDQTSGFFQSDPRATTPFAFVTNDSTFQFSALALDANQIPVDIAQTHNNFNSPNNNDSGGPVDFLGLGPGASFAPVFLANIYNFDFTAVLGSIEAGYVGDTPTFVITNTSSDTFDSPSLFAADPASPPANSVPEPASLTLLVMGTISVLAATRCKMLRRVF